jgi:hypothetical protein
MKKPGIAKSTTTTTANANAHGGKTASVKMGGVPTIEKVASKIAQKYNDQVG